MVQKRIALVTGGSRGLGRDMAIRLAEKGNDVVITYQVQKEAAEDVLKIIAATGQKGVALPLDTSDFNSLDKFVELFASEIEKAFGTTKFDFLVNNAGIGATVPFADVTEELFDKFLNIHFKSVYFLTQKLLPLMNNNGSIVNISTGTTRFANPGYSVYASMKGAVEVFSKYLAKEVGTKGINVNVVAPGPIETDFNNAAIRNSPERKALMGQLTALGRVGQASDIGGVVAFLCSDDGKWINGQRIEVTGGINL